MRQGKTISMNLETYQTISRISMHGFYLSIVNSSMMILLTLCTKPKEVIYFDAGEIISSFNVSPLYFSLLFHIIALTLFKIAVSKIVEAKKGEIQGKNRRDPNGTIGYDFSGQGFVEVLEPTGSGSNQWFVYWGIGLVTALVGSMTGAITAIFAAASAPIPQFMMGRSIDMIRFFLEPYIILCVSAAVSQLFTLVKVPAGGLMVMPNIFQHSLDVHWTDDLRKVLEWRLDKRKSPKPSSTYTKTIPWKVKQRFWRKTTMSVKLSPKGCSDEIADHLQSFDAIILHKDSHQIVAEQGKRVWWEAKDAKKKIFVRIDKIGANSSEISVDLRFPLTDTLLMYSLVFLAIFLTIVAYQLDALLGTIVGLFLIFTLLPLMIWYFFEKDAIIRDLWYRFHRKGIFEDTQIKNSPRKKCITERLVNLARVIVTRLDDLYRIVFGGGIVKGQDFPFMPMYMFRDYRSNLHEYGKTADFLTRRRKEGKAFDFADTTSRIDNEIQHIESNEYGDVVYNGKIIASKINKPTAVLKNIKVIGRSSSVLPLSPWASLVMIGLGVLLFFLSFDIAQWSVSKTLFALIISFGLWVILGTLLTLLFENSSTLVYTPESAQILGFLGAFPVIAGLSFLLIPEGSYSPKVGMDLWAFSMVVFGVTIASHTSGKPFSRSLYFYSRNSAHLPYKSKEDVPYWLKANYYWVFRFVLQWLWEIALPPHRDFERLEVWVNAEDGRLEWVVTDYHYRELWYRAPPDSHEIIFWWDSNFHSFHPILDKEAIQLFRKLKGSSRIDSNYRNRLLQISDEIAKRHSAEEVGQFFKGLEKLGAKKCARLPWTYWRYPFGAYPKKNLERWKKYAVDHGGHGAALPEEQFF